MRKYKKQLLDKGLDSLITASKKVAYKADEFIGNEIADAVTNSNDDKIVKEEHLLKRSLFHYKKEMKYSKN